MEDPQFNRKSEKAGSLTVGGPRTSIRKASHSSGSLSSHGHRKHENDPNKIWDYLPKKFRGKKREGYIRRHSDMKLPSTYKKFALMMWKNSLITRRRWKASLAILTVPILFVTLFTIITFSLRDPEYIILTPKPPRPDGSTEEPFPREDSILSLSVFLPTAIVIGFGVSSLIMAYFKVRERQMGVWKIIEMYGIKNSFHMFAWILHHLIYLGLCSLCITFILSGDWKNTIYRSSAIIKENQLSQMFFVLLFCYVFQVLCTMTLFVSFFKKAWIACVAMSIIWVALYAPYIYIFLSWNRLSFLVKLFSCASCNVALGIGCKILDEIDAERWDAPALGTWKNMFPYYLVMVSYGVAKLVVCQYVTKVHPEGGMSKLPWNYLCKLWYWRKQQPPDNHPTEKINEPSFEQNHPENFEHDRHIKKRKELVIEHLSKYHKNVRAIHKVNLVCHMGHVTVFLGKEKSGKSTLLKLLTGTMAPSFGTIYLNRKDLYKDHVLAKAFVGYCPNENLLFPDLTVEETIQFFTDLKGLTHRIEAYEDVERILKITKLNKHRQTRVCDLSKGLQRILMIATAYCGGSRVVLIDEPTMDLNKSEEKLLWDFTGQEKKHRTVVVAMDLGNDLDYVVDKIVVMHHGQIVTRGSPEFLQHQFGGDGCGYHLIVTTTPNSHEEDLIDFVESNVPGSFIHERKDDEINFYLPPSQSSAFPVIVDELDYWGQDYYVIKDYKLKFITPQALQLILKRSSRETANFAKLKEKQLQNSKKILENSMKAKKSEVKIDMPANV